MDKTVLHQKLAKLIRDTDGICGLCVRAAGGPPLFQHNAELRFPSASLIKLPIYYEYQRQVLSGKLQADSCIRLQKKHWVDGSGVLKQAEPGSQYRLDYIAHVMLTQSDNIATNLLIGRLGFQAIGQSIKELGMAGTALQRRMYDFEARDRGLDNWTTPGDVQAFLWRILNPASHEEEICAGVIAALKDQRINHKLPALLPPGTVIAHKTGELDGVQHNAGIIYGPTATFCITAMTQNLGSNQAGVAFCRQAALLAYETLNP